MAQLVKNLPAMRETWVRPVGWEDLLKKGTATSVFWPGEFHGLYSAWGCKELDTTEQLALSVFKERDSITRRHLGRRDQGKEIWFFVVSLIKADRSDEIWDLILSPTFNMK